MKSERFCTKNNPLPRLRGRVGEGEFTEERLNRPSESPDWRVTRESRTRAKQLRRDMTEAEKIIWGALRAHRMYGVSFRRQTPIGPYIADFVAHSAKLVIELDGGQHFEPAALKRDQRRDAFLQSKGFAVLRFTNHDVMLNRQGVLETIATALTKRPLPSPPPQAGEGTTGRRAAGVLTIERRK